jgi:5-carboxyvanillate decarboxylase
MTLDRRALLAAGTALLSGNGLVAAASDAAIKPTQNIGKRHRRIATEEAYAVPELVDGVRSGLQSGAKDADTKFWAVLLGENPWGKMVLRRLLDLEQERLAIMDQHGVDMHVLSITVPGPQMFDSATGTRLATVINDRLAEVITRHPQRFAGLAAVAPQDPQNAAKEIERAVTQLHLNGVIINSHTHDEYLDDPKFWPIFEAAAAHQAPIYLHPRAPSKMMLAPFEPYALEHAIWGYQAEAGLHAVRLVMSGVFDRFPNLKIVLGHMGEGVPYWFYRIDYMHRGASRFNWRPQLAKAPSEYFKSNFMITTSGMNWNPVLEFCVNVVGPDNIMFAVDYPYQETPEAVRFMDAAPLSEADRAKIYHGNAERVFRISNT